MLAQKNRFHGHGSLKYVYRKGDKVYGQRISIKYATNKRRKNSRVAVVVSKKVLKSAVGRNRIRRRIYEIIRTNMIHFNKNYDIAILVFSSEIMHIPSKDLEEIVTKKLKQAGILQ